MLTEKQLEKYADVLIWGLKTARTGKYRKGNIILIRYDMPAIRLAEILYSKILNMGMHPVIRMGLTPFMERNFFEISDNKQLAFISPGDEELYNNLNGSIYLHAPESITHLSHIDSSKIGKAAISRKRLRDILDKREEDGVFGWNSALIPQKSLQNMQNLL